MGIKTTKGSKPARSAGSLPSQAVDRSQGQIERALAGYQIFRDRRLVQMFNIVPPLILVVTIIYVFGFWYSRGVAQIDFAIAGLTTILSMIVMRSLFARFPQALLAIWRRGLLKPRAEPQQSGASLAPDALPSQFQRFISHSEDLLNSRGSVIFGVAVMVIVLWLFWPLRVISAQDWLVRFQTAWAETAVSVILRLMYYVAAFVAGLILWRVVMIARTVSQLSQEFDFDLQAEHPDNCGGFRPIGDLCLDLAYIFAPLLLAIGGWLIVINVVRPELLETVANIPAVTLPSIVATLQVLIVLVVTLSLFGFFQPLTSIHEGMSRARDQYQDELDRISQEIHEASTELRTNAENLTAEQGTFIEQKIDFLRRVYTRNMKIPTWPINYDHIWRLLTIQVAPAVGIVTSGVGLVNAVTTLFK